MPDTMCHKIRAEKVALGCCHKVGVLFCHKEPSDSTYVKTINPFFTGLFVLAISLATVAALSDPSLIDTGFDIWDKLQHALTYCFLAFLLARCYPACLYQKHPPIAQSAFLLGYGILIEYLQSLTPYREPSLLDVVANVTGIGIYSLIHLMIHAGEPPSDTA